MLLRPAFTVGMAPPFGFRGFEIRIFCGMSVTVERTSWIFFRSAFGISIVAVWLSRQCLGFVVNSVPMRLTGSEVWRF